MNGKGGNGKQKTTFFAADVERNGKNANTKQFFQYIADAAVAGPADGGREWWCEQLRNDNNNI